MHNALLAVRKPTNNPAWCAVDTNAHLLGLCVFVDQSTPISILFGFSELALPVTHNQEQRHASYNNDE